MISDVRRLRSAFELAASQLRMRYSAFSRSLGLGDFFLDAEAGGWEPKELAAQAIEQLIEGNRSQNDFAVCLAVTRFLDGTYGTPAADRTTNQRIKDLASLTTSTRSPKAILEWIDAWYS